MIPEFEDMIKNEFPNRGIQAECPVCNSKNQKVLAAYTSSDPLDHLSISSTRKEYSFLQDQIKASWVGDSCHFLECQNCKLNFAFPFEAGTNELYSSFYSSSDSYGSLNWEHRMTGTLINEKINKSNKEVKYFLEMGAGDGAFVKQIAEKYFKKNNIFCTESSQYAVNALNDYGITCLKGSSPLNSEDYKSKFHVIAMFQVLEHLDRIDDLFKIINHISEKNADLFIAVPNYSVRKLYEENRIFLDVPPVHITRWSQDSFQYLGAKYGWRIINYQVEKVSFFSAAYNFIWNKSLRKSVGKIKKKFIRKPLIAVLLPPLFLANFLEIIKLDSKANGISQLVHLNKI